MAFYKKDKNGNRIKMDANGNWPSEDTEVPIQEPVVEPAPAASKAVKPVTFKQELPAVGDSNGI